MNRMTIPGTAAQPQAYNPYAPAPTTPQIPGVAAPYNPYAAPAQPAYNPYAPTTQPAYNPYAPAVAPQIPGVAQVQAPYNPYAPAAPAAIPGMAPGSIPGAPGYRPNPGIPGAPQIPGAQPAYNPYAPTAPAQPQAYNPYVPAAAPVGQIPGMTIPGVAQPQQPIGISPEFMSSECLLQSQSHYLQNGIPSESEHTYNFLYSSSKTKEEIVDYIKDRDPFYSSQENGDITIYSTNIGIYFVCNNTITNSNFLEAVLKSALIRNYRILDNGYVAFISEIAISCTESITKDSIISFAKYLCQKNYLLTLRKEQFIFTNLGTLLFLDFSNLIPKEYIMGLEKYLTSPTGEVLYQEPSLLFNNVDCLFIDIFKKKYFKRNETIEIEKRITNFNQLKRGVWR